MTIRETLKERIATAAGVAPEAVPLEHPADFSHGDYATPIALSVAKKKGTNPRELAENIAEDLAAQKPAEVESVTTAGPGFINITLTDTFFTEQTKTIVDAPDAWGRAQAWKGKRVLVEYTQPNPFKEFHIGHLMSNAVGETLSRLIEFSGAEVKRANYQGDVGLHVAKALWGVKQFGGSPDDVALLGKAYAAGAKAYGDDEAAREAILDINRKLYARSDSELNELYDAGRQASLAHFEEIYKKLGTDFDYYFFESEAAPRGMEIVRAHPGVFEESDGAIVYRGEQDGLHTRVFITSEGLPTYEVKELGLLALKGERWDFDMNLTITATEQDAYFQVVEKAMEKALPELAPKMHHLSHGMLRLPSGKMSSRTGEVITGESLLADLEAAVRERQKEGAREGDASVITDVAVAAIKYAILKQAIGHDVIFERERALSLEGDSGPYLQYTYARTRAILEKAGETGVVPNAEGARPSVNDVERLLYRFPEVVERAADEYAPQLVAAYLTELASAFNTWYGAVRIVDDSAEAPYKVALTHAVGVTLKNGLWTLGIRAPERM